MKKILETERLYLRELSIDDTEDLMKVLSDPESMRFYPKPFAREDVEAWIRWNLENYEKYGHGLWAVIRKDGNVFLGDCGITMQEIDEETVPEIGYHIIREYWRMGYATEAAFACKEYGFHTLHYPKIYSYSRVANTPSQKTAAKIGLQICKRFVKNGAEQIAYVRVNPEGSFSESGK